MTPEDIKKIVDEAVEQRLQEREHREGLQNARSREPQLPSLSRLGHCRRSEENVEPKSQPASVLRLHWIRTLGLRQAVRVSPQSYRRRLLWIFNIAPTESQS